jgi:hypothetical protein
MRELDRDQHVFRHVKRSSMDGDFVEPAAFRLTPKNGVLEDGLSVNWVEYFGKPTPHEAVALLREILIKKGRTVSGTSRFALLNVGAVKDAAAMYAVFALLNVGAVKDAAAMYAVVSVATDDDPQDPSHTQITGQTAFNDEVAEGIATSVITTFPSKPSGATN